MEHYEIDRQTMHAFLDRTLFKQVPDVKLRLKDIPEAYKFYAGLEDNIVYITLSSGTKPVMRWDFVFPKGSRYLRQIWKDPKVLSRMEPIYTIHNATQVQRLQRLRKNKQQTQQQTQSLLQRIARLEQRTTRIQQKLDRMSASPRVQQLI